MKTVKQSLRKYRKQRPMRIDYYPPVDVAERILRHHSQRTEGEKTIAGILDILITEGDKAISGNGGK